MQLSRCLCLLFVVGYGAAEARAETEPFALSLDTPLSPSQRTTLEGYGVRLDDYVDGVGYVERLSPGLARRIESSFSGMTVSPFSPTPPTIGRPTMSGDVRIRAVVWNSRAAASLVSHFEHINRKILNEWDPERPMIHDIEVLDFERPGIRPRVLARIPLSMHEHVLARPEVRHLERLPTRQMDGDGSAEMLQSGSAGKSPLWDRGLNGSGQIVTVLDSGCVERWHCWFRHTKQDPGDSHRKLRHVKGRAKPHATFVGGIVAGHNPADTHDKGHAWSSCIVSIGGMTRTGAPLLPQLEAACRDGARIHTNSWHEHFSPKSYKYNGLDEEVDRFSWEHEDHLVIGSSGNPSSTGPPGTAKNALSVSASYLPPPDGRENNHGEGVTGPLGGRRKPDLVTPGCPVRSSMRGDRNLCRVGAHACATSWAAPAAAAAAAMVRQYFTEGWYPKGTRVDSYRMTPTGSLIKAILIHSGRDMTGVEGFPSNREGYGLIQLNRTLYFHDCANDTTDCGHNLWVQDVRHASGLHAGSQPRTYELNVKSSTKPLKVVLAWADAPSKSDSPTTLVNDLDLTVSGPGGTFYGGNVIDGRSCAVDKRDRVNNVELVLLPEPKMGEWHVTVSAPAVNVLLEDRPGQGYALVVTGDLGQQPALSNAPYYVEESVSVCSTKTTATCPR